ncbi:hypothetical protein HS1genome_0607 [Sulfodiicoccus acidiphilus]|uniref:Uncharacterized protein n=1 Tax=Sulfodiicoccus acidiphilus TaxID=1670455 RepID=A0A348B216_9CREN|nr:hypothetical protein HS1genome_0607 [Sulfodiicoccus acidiphilus]
MYAYVAFSFMELLFNREFLAGVIPVGMAGISLERVFYPMFLVGGASFVLMTLMQPLILGVTAYKSRGTGLSWLLWASLYLTLFLDGTHLVEGVNNTAFNPPVFASVLYVVVVVAGGLLSAKKISKWLYVFLIPDLLAFLYLLGTWGIQLTGNSDTGYLSLWAAEAMGYSVILSAAAFLVWALPRARRWILMGSLVVGLIVGTVVGLNLVPGMAIAIGVMFPYAFGVLGVENWMPPVIFALGLASVIVATSLLKKERGVSASFLALASAALIFDSVNITTYLVAPLVALCVGMLLDERLRTKAELG